MTISTKWTDITPIPSKVSLEKGEEHCPKCKGTGVKGKTRDGFYINCKKCKGYGKFDWVQKVVGVKKEKTRVGLYNLELNLTSDDLLKSSEWCVENADDS